MTEIKKQWYEENPELLAVEKVAMEKLAEVDHKEFVFLKDGSACWHISFESELSGRKYNVAIVYPEEHPGVKEVYTSIKVYLIDPTYEILLEEFNAQSGKDYNCMSYSVRDGAGRWYLSLCETETAYKAILAKRESNCVISAANVLLATKDWIEFYEKGVANKGVGFDRCTIIDPEKEKQACIGYFGVPAVEYYLKSSN